MSFSLFFCPKYLKQSTTLVKVNAILLINKLGEFWKLCLYQRKYKENEEE